MDIEAYLSRHEGKTLEFKRDATSPSGIVRTIVAFANTAGGDIVIGVADRSRAVIGIADPLQLEERLASIIADSIEPTLVPEIDIVSWRDKALLVLHVYPGPVRPYRVRSAEPGQGVYVRIGSTNRLADHHLALELGRSRSERSFDEETLPGLKKAEVDVEAVRTAFEGVRDVRTESSLLSLRVLEKEGGRVVPTVGGILLFGKRRTQLYPDAVIDAGRFAGSDRRAFVDSARFEEPLPTAVQYAMAFIKRNIANRLTVGEVRHVEVWQYPIEAVREILVNAVVHADYSPSGSAIRVSIFDERIEIDSPGTLLPGLTVEDVRRGVSRTRNRVIARVFRELGMIEQWGTGIPRAIEACRSAGLPDPEIEELGFGLRVTLRAARQAAEVDAMDARVIGALQAEKGLSTAEVAERIGRTTRATRDRLKGLVAAGLVAEIGSSPTDPHRKYVIAEDRASYSVRSKRR
jgi:predicted HTH transcriptional regulator